MKRIWIYSLHLTKTRIALITLGLFLLYLGYKPAADYVWKQSIEALSWSIANKIIVIDPGHGGVDPGAIGHNGTIEKEVTLEVSKRLESLLSMGGAVVLMTRETDMDHSTPGKGIKQRKREDLTKRAKMANDARAQIYVSVHCNKFSQSQYRGAQTFGMTGSKESARLAKTIQDELKRVLGNTTREAKHEAFFVNRTTKMPSVIVEIGFLSNPDEEYLLKQPDYQSKVAYAIYAGIVKYFAEGAEMNN